MNYSEPTFINCPVTARGQRFRDHKTFSDRLHPPHSRWSGGLLPFSKFFGLMFSLSWIHRGRVEYSFKKSEEQYVKDLKFWLWFVVVRF